MSVLNQEAGVGGRRMSLPAMRLMAASLLIAMSLLYLVAVTQHHQGAGWGYLRATAEASMVGGLADWFAVTAIFRRPLGLPIPHTAIVPTRKDRVGRTLGAFVQKNFLTREVIEGKLRTLNAGERLAQWIATPENARLIARHAATSLAAGAQMLREEDVQAMIDRGVENRIRETRVAPLVGKV